MQTVNSNGVYQQADQSGAAEEQDNEAEGAVDGEWALCDVWLSSTICKYILPTNYSTETL